MKVRPFTKLGYRRWTDEEKEILKERFIEGREEEIPHKQLWEDIAEKLGRKPSEVQKKLNRMYEEDEDLKNYKRNSWSREKILEQLKELYLNNEPVHKSALPNHLCFTILKAVNPSSRLWFDSVDHAIAEAIYEVGHPRLEDGSLDKNYVFEDIEDALDYVRHGHKKRHIWTLDEVRAVLQALHEADFPLTIPFLTNHYRLYKDVVRINRKLESFKDVIKKFIEEGDIQSYPELVCSIAPEYKDYYNKDGSRLKLSTEEIRVKKFLDRFRISYRIPKLGHKIPTNLDNYAHFIPDFIIFNEQDRPCAIIEVFGSISDRQNADVGNIYKEKTEAKRRFWNSVEGIEFIEIYNNNDRCDLDDRTLFSLLGPYMHKTKFDLQDLITTDEKELQEKEAKYGAAILYSNSRKKYLVRTGGMNFELDKLFDLSSLDPKNPAMKEILKIINRSKEQEKAPQETRTDNTKDYEPPKKDPFYDHNRWIAPPIDVVHRSI